MTVNGRPYAYREGLTLHRLLAELAIEPRRVAVMRGDDIYRSNDIPDVALDDRDVIEIVTAMAGG